MYNSMDINFRGDNPISNLSFHWKALFKDGTQIYQLENNVAEHRFQEVKDRFDDLVYFNLTNNAGKMFTVNLLNGLIGYNRLEFPYIESEDKEKYNIRLIYFRRNTIEVELNYLKKQKHTIIYHLGLQWNDKQGNNHKIVLQIDEEGNFIIGD